MKNAILLVAVVAILGFYRMKFLNRDTFENGTYHNKKLGFALDFPGNWSEVDKDEVLGGFGQALEFTDVDTRLFVSPSNPEDAIFIITQIPGNADRISQLSVEDVARSFGQMGMKIDLKKAEYIGGFDVFRVDGTLRDNQYMQIAMFAVDDTLVQLQFNGKLPFQRGVRQDLENIIGSLNSRL